MQKKIVMVSFSCLDRNDDKSPIFREGNLPRVLATGVARVGLAQSSRREIQIFRRQEGTRRQFNRRASRRAIEIADALLRDQPEIRADRVVGRRQG